MLPTPTLKLVEAACSEFDHEAFTNLAEQAIEELISKFPQNLKASHVLLKVVALDRLYSTRIDYVDLLPFAHHIATQRIDDHIAEGSPNAVDLIWNCENTRHYYSFATKYCSWHNPAFYPMHDHYVDECLWAYKKQDQFCEFHRQDMYDYEKFVPIVSAFRNHYGLASISFKQLDKFLWLSGDRILRNRSDPDSAH